MKNEFVPYDIALGMEGLGYIDPFFTYYDRKDQSLLTKPSEGVDGSYEQLKNLVAAPLYQQAFRWFMEKYDLFGYVFPNDYQQFGFSIKRAQKPEYETLHYDWGTNETPKDAQDACLRNLIEIVKEKKDEK